MAHVCERNVYFVRKLFLRKIPELPIFPYSLTNFPVIQNLFPAVLPLQPVFKNTVYLGIEVCRKLRLEPVQVAVGQRGCCSFRKLLRQEQGRRRCIQDFRNLYQRLVAHPGTASFDVVYGLR